MAANAKADNLLYIPTYEGIEVFSYPQDVLVGQLTGLSSAYGDCTDAAGNVYITSYSADTVVEFAHGGTKAIRTLSVPGSGVLFCAVDPSSGDLAVTVAGDTSGSGAQLVVFANARGKPKIFTDAAILNYEACTYDDAGNLFVDGTPAKGYGYDYELAELPKSGKTLEAVTLGNGISWGAPLQRNGRYLAVGQPVIPNISRYTISNGQGTFEGSTQLSDAYDAIAFVLAGNRAIVVNQYYYDKYIVKWDVLVFKYPAGGDEKQLILGSGEPIYDVALSRPAK